MKAMILAAGFGTRLGGLTSRTPKAMLDVEGKPLLEYIIANLRRHGFDEIVVNLHFEGDQIRRYFADGAHWGVRLTYSEEQSPLGTAGGVKNVAHFFTDEDFLLHYGDVVTDEDFRAMLQFHRNHVGVATLLVHRRPNSNSILTLDSERRITRFLERPSTAERTGLESQWVHSGVCIARRALLEEIPADRTADLARDVYVPLVERGRALFAWQLTGYRCAVDSPKRLESLRTAVGNGLLSFARRPNE